MKWSRRNCSESFKGLSRENSRASAQLWCPFFGTWNVLMESQSWLGAATLAIPQDISLDRRNIRLETRPVGVLMWPYVSNYQRGLWLRVCEGTESTGVEDVSAGGLLIRAVYLPLQSLIELNGWTSSIDMLVGDFVASNYRHVAAAADKSGSLPAATIVSRNWVTRS